MRIKQLEEEVRKLRKGAAGAPGDSTNDVDINEGFDKEVEALKRDIKFLEGMSDGESLLASKKQRLQALPFRLAGPALLQAQERCAE